jgi:hypothetical protein
LEWKIQKNPTKSSILLRFRVWSGKSKKTLLNPQFCGGLGFGVENPKNPTKSSILPRFRV